MRLIMRRMQHNVELAEQRARESRRPKPDAASGEQSRPRDLFVNRRASASMRQSRREEAPMLIQSARSWEIREAGRRPSMCFSTGADFWAQARRSARNLALPARRRAADDPTSLALSARRNVRSSSTGITPERSTPTTIISTNSAGRPNMSRVWRRALKTQPWTVKIDGLVGSPKDRHRRPDRAMQIEERLYRHRCVEAWSMAVPWTGFPLAALVKAADPKPEAKYLQFETFLDPKMAPASGSSRYPGLCRGRDAGRGDQRSRLHGDRRYGKPLANQFGAPLRLALP